MLTNKHYSISIIVPVYNVSSYILDCLDSIALQDFCEPMECLIIDDCGQDESVQICENYISTYSGNIDFRIIHHETNMGLSAARNTGIKEAKGKYISFIDSDDYIAPSYFSVLYHEISMAENSVSIIACSCYADREGVISDFFDHPILREKIEPEEYVSSMLLCKVPFMAWGKLYKREILSTIRFREGKTNEDSLFALDFYPEVEEKQIRMLVIPDQLYYYRIRPNSICTSKKRPFFIDRIVNVEEIMSKTINNKIEVYQEHLKIYIFLLINTISEIVKKDHICHDNFYTYTVKLFKIRDIDAKLYLSASDYKVYLFQKYLPFVYLIIYR